MSTSKGSKLNQLLQNIPKGSVILASWLNRQGYSHDLQQKYLQSHWLEPIGRGAFKRSGDEIDIYGAIYALQKQAEKKIHIGGPSALFLLGYAHYIPMEQGDLILFTQQGFKLPAWFTTYNWKVGYLIRQTNMLPAEKALTSYSTKSFQINISTAPRAMLECLELSPKNFDLEEAWLIMEGLSALQPELVQELLEQCRSIKAKRLFLFLADKAGHSWFKYLDISKIQLGKGKRSIVNKGVFIPKYQITIPKNLK